MTLKEVRQIVRKTILEWQEANDENLMLNKDSKMVEPDVRAAIKKYLKAMMFTGRGSK